MPASRPSAKQLWGWKNGAQSAFLRGRAQSPHAGLSPQTGSGSNLLLYCEPAGSLIAPACDAHPLAQGRNLVVEPPLYSGGLRDKDQPSRPDREGENVEGRCVMRE